MRGSRVRWLNVAALALLLLPRPLLSHGALKSSRPARTSSQPTLPAELALTFTERIELSLAQLVLVRDGRDTVPLGARELRNNGFVLAAAITGDRSIAGSYVIHWRITGKDGHPVNGTIPFTVTGAAVDSVVMDSAEKGVTAAAAEDSGDAHAAHVAEGSPAGSTSGGIFASNNVLQVSARYAAYVATMLVFGAIATMLVVASALATQGRGTAGVSLRSRAANVGEVAAVVLVLVDLLRLYLQYRAVSTETPVGIGDLLVTTWGRAWVLHIAMACMLALVLPLMRRKSNVVFHGLLIGASVALAVAAAMGGHASAAAQPTRAIALDAAHLVAGGAWIGTLLVLFLFGVRRFGSDATTLLVALRSFSRLAIVSAIVLVFSGLGSAWIHVGQLDAFLSTSYGRTLAVKLALFVIVIGFGAFNQRTIRSEHTAAASSVSTVTGRARIEVLAALLLLLVTSILASTPTPPHALHQ